MDDTKKSAMLRDYVRIARLALAPACTSCFAKMPWPDVFTSQKPIELR